MSSMFYKCSKVSKIYVSKKWNVNNVTSDSLMFRDCYNLPFYDPNKADDKIYAHYNTGGYLTYKEATT